MDSRTALLLQLNDSLPSALNIFTINGRLMAGRVALIQQIAEDIKSLDASSDPNRAAEIINRLQNALGIVQEAAESSATAATAIRAVLSNYSK